MIHLPWGTPECALVSSSLGALDSDAERIDPRIAEPVADNLIRLVAIAAGIAPEMKILRPQAVRSAALRRVMEHAGANLADPTLSPSGARRRLGMSVRKLHMLFAPTGLELRRMAASPAHRRGAIAARQSGDG